MRRDLQRDCRRLLGRERTKATARSTASALGTTTREKRMQKSRAQSGSEGSVRNAASTSDGHEEPTNTAATRADASIPVDPKPHVEWRSCHRSGSRLQEGRTRL